MCYSHDFIGSVWCLEFLKERATPYAMRAKSPTSAMRSALAMDEALALDGGGVPANGGGLPPAGPPRSTRRTSPY